MSPTEKKLLGKKLDLGKRRGESVRFIVNMLVCNIGVERFCLFKNLNGWSSKDTE